MSGVGKNCADASRNGFWDRVECFGWDLPFFGLNIGDLMGDGIVASSFKSWDRFLRLDETDFGVTWPKFENLATWRLGGVAGHSGGIAIFGIYKLASFLVKSREI